MDHLFDGLPFEVYGKLEKLNPGGSIKDRAAQSMIERAIRRGEIVPGRTTVIESSSGNLGIAVAMLCQEHGLNFICVPMPRPRQRTFDSSKRSGPLLR